MKLFAFAALPIAVLASSCYYGVPYDEPSTYGAPPPPYARPGFGQEPYDGPRGGVPRYPSEPYRPDGETGSYRQVPPPGGSSSGNPAREAPPRGPQLDPYGDPEASAPQQPSQPAPNRSSSHPTAERTENPNRVLSPYAPYNVIDITGFKSGQLAKDPSNGKIFRVP